MKLQLQDTWWELLPEKAMYRRDTETLILADLHLGKATHFRKSGIAIPAGSANHDYKVLYDLIEYKEPRNVYLLGDLFHSTHNSEWQQFDALTGCFPQVCFTLIMGNHDILKRHHYEAANLRIIDDHLTEDGWIYSHKPLENVPAEYINIAGHIHPGCRIEGIARQSISLPCFYFSPPLLLLPAFGHLTGLKILSTTDAEVFAVTGDSVVRV